MNPPYSLVCAGKHVLADEVAYQPPIEDNGTKLCSEPGCFQRVYTHCTTCQRPLPGYMDGVRVETHGNVSRAVGQLGTARGILPERVWREECPHCKSPYPWASRTVLANYHAKYLDDQKDTKPVGLRRIPEAEAAYKAMREASKKARKADKRHVRRSRPDHWWTSRAALVTGIFALLTAVVTGLFLLLSKHDDPPVAPAPTTISTTTSQP